MMLMPGVGIARGSKEGATMKIKLCSLLVENQDKALTFYTDKLGFVKKQEVPAGEFRWLTVVSPEDPDGTELSLEPNVNPAAKTFQKAMFGQGIPFTAFAVDDIERTHETLTARGVRFHSEPKSIGPAKLAVFDDTCGNLIQIYEVVAPS